MDRITQNAFTFRAGSGRRGWEEGIEVRLERLPIGTAKISERTTGAHMVKFMLSEGIEERNEDWEMIGVEWIGGEVAGRSWSRDGPEDRGGEVG